MEELDKKIEELIKKVNQILNQFLREELGNRLSQFSMKSLRDMILDEIKNYKLEDNKKMLDKIKLEKEKKIMEKKS